MAADLVVAPEAELDIEDAYAWYEERRFGLGEDFLGRVDACIHAIRRNPELYGQVFKQYRRALVRGFPYGVFYEFANNTVSIFCIIHNSRNPRKWRDRLP